MSGALRSVLAVMESGFESAGVVMGSVTYQIQHMSPCFSPGVLQRALLPCTYYESSVRGAWRTAIGRLEEDAARRGAHGVVGVWANNQSAAAGLQISLIGTAVRVPGVEPLG
ncbi:MAG: heavy metal-binding domain-containing protein [Acidimicrobiales bacterium]